MRLGIVGLPNVGKSTLFNALTKAGAPAENYPFCTIDPNIATVILPDERLDIIKDIYNSERKVPTSIEFVDIAGLVKGASRGEGLGNKFLANIREVDAIIHVVRCFESTNIVHVDGSIDPVRDVETINMELIFSDMDRVDRHLEKVERAAKSRDPKLLREVELLKYIKSNLEKGILARNIDFSGWDRAIVDDLLLLTYKPVIYVANVSEEDIERDNTGQTSNLAEYAKSENAEILVICAGIEEEIAQLDDDEREMFLEEMGILESSLDKLIRSSYSILGLISYFTANEKEASAWTIKRGTKAPRAAGKVHTDFERGFIRAEVIPYRQLVEMGSPTVAREKGLIRSEGRDYIVEDGDVILFRFNVD